MKSRMFAIFSLGALAATISLGAVQFAAASGGSTITACANKSTGAMRLLAKGSCKKTERKVVWNQEGIQGQTGAQGIPGTPGVNGVNGVNKKSQINLFQPIMSGVFLIPVPSSPTCQ